MSRSSRSSIRSVDDVSGEEVNRIIVGDVIARMGRDTKLIDSRPYGGKAFLSDSQAEELDKEIIIQSIDSHFQED